MFDNFSNTFNRNILYCKLFFQISYPLRKKYLIETFCIVNNSFHYSNICSNINLIETFCIVNFIVTFARQYVDFI